MGSSYLPLIEAECPANKQPAHWCTSGSVWRSGRVLQCKFAKTSRATMDRTRNLWHQNFLCQPAEIMSVITEHHKFIITYNNTDPNIFFFFFLFLIFLFEIPKTNLDIDFFTHIQKMLVFSEIIRIFEKMFKIYIIVQVYRSHIYVLNQIFV